MSTSGPPRTLGAHHVAVQARDLAVSEKFYAGVLGLKELRRWPSHDGDGDRSVWFDLGDGSFLALERSRPDASHMLDTPFVHPHHAGWHLVSLRIDVADRARWIARLEANGVRVDHRTDFTLYVRDPDGNRVGLSAWPLETR